MTKLPRNIKGRSMIKLLKKLGFIETNRKGSHIRFKHSNGRVTQIAIHPKPIPPGTLRAILRQIDIDIDEFIKKI